MNHNAIRIFIHASTWFAPILVPFVAYLAISDREIRSLSLQAVLFHLVIWSLITISMFLSWIIIGVPFLIVFGAMALTVPIIGIIRTLQNQNFQYPIVKNWVK